LYGFGFRRNIPPDPGLRTGSAAGCDIQDVKVTKDLLDLARHIVEQKAGRFEPDKFEDQYETALVDLINQKRAGKPITANGLAATTCST
jgi:non-homologous end joining protein Ku